METPLNWVFEEIGARSCRHERVTRIEVSRLFLEDYYRDQTVRQAEGRADAVEFVRKRAQEKPKWEVGDEAGFLYGIRAVVCESGFRVLSEPSSEAAITTSLDLKAWIRELEEEVRRMRQKYAPPKDEGTE